jgi:hypothetical protein
MGSHLGGMGDVVVNAVGRTLTRKAVGKAMKIAKPASGKIKKAGPKKGSAKGKQEGRWVCRELGIEKGVHDGS